MGDDNAQQDLGEARLQLERERLEIERAKSAFDLRFLNRNLATVITAAISLAAVLVSFSQVWVAKIGRDRELNLGMVQFVSQNSDKIFGGNEEQRTRIRNVILVAFPEEITAALFAKLEQTADSSEAVKTWHEGHQVVAEIASTQGSTEVGQVRVFLHYRDAEDAPLLDSLMDKLRDKGYKVPGRQRVSQETRGDVRFYHEGDRTHAEQIRRTVEEHLASAGRKQEIHILYLGDRFKNVPPGVIEIWIPGPQG